jgi:hypothetical protein
MREPKTLPPNNIPGRLPTPHQPNKGATNVNTSNIQIEIPPAINYPAEIEQARIDIVGLSERIAELTDEIGYLDDSFTKIVLEATIEGSKPKYSNETARGIAIRELQRESIAYRKHTLDLRLAQAEKSGAEARLERLRGEFREQLINKLLSKETLVAELV